MTLVCGLLVVMSHQLNTVIAVLYRPPNTRIDKFTDTLKKLNECFSNVPTPTHNIALMGDFNFNKSTITWFPCEEDGDLIPIVANHKDTENLDGKQDRLHAAKLCDLTTKFCLVQQVAIVTHGTEI